MYDIVEEWMMYLLDHSNCCLQWRQMLIGKLLQSQYTDDRLEVKSVQL